ncbi:hypothetical protein N7447_008867 [Penicillium robsamsonii]|uniref:uncharacterized protein n=1 Tax=Penicillium robsamsonii TaxID=1792511 RepID=UPI0025488D44|nr:uncharacterized protein N7447_008867 [Penicillium robsamsonii]KAJ5816634.1 hypothetical protein N7447_008867 [Penicillium robsamsonii]
MKEVFDIKRWDGGLNRSGLRITDVHNTLCEWKEPSGILFRFGISIRDSNRPQFTSGYLLLSLALAHGALFRVNTVDDLA